MNKNLTAVLEAVGSEIFYYRNIVEEDEKITIQCCVNGFGFEACDVNVKKAEERLAGQILTYFDWQDTIDSERNKEIVTDKLRIHLENHLISTAFIFCV